MEVPLLDLKPQYQKLKAEFLRVTEEVYTSQHFILGPRVAALETAIAEYCGCRFAVGVSSGTDALLISLMASGVGPGDRVLTTPYTFFATAGAIARAGARPVFADIDPETYNLDPESVRRVLSSLGAADRRTIKALVPVHLFGQCAPMTPLMELARDEGWIVIEDAAQGIGAEYRGQRAGSMGSMGCFSFFPSKNLGAFGDGGIVTTSSESVDRSLRTLRVHGGTSTYIHDTIGGNFRLDALQAAIVSVKLPHLDGWTRGRQQNADTYRRLFAEAGLSAAIGLPKAIEDRHIYNQFVIRLASGRDGLKQYLSDAGVGTAIYYPVPLHLQTCFADLGYAEGDFPVAEAAAEQTLALPIYPELTDAQQAYVVSKIAEFYTDKR